MDENILISLENVYKIYQSGEEEIHALDGINLTIKKGELTAIVGQSGSGKSTAMNIIGCLDVPTSGSYYLMGKDVSKLDEQLKNLDVLLLEINSFYTVPEKIKGGAIKWLQQKYGT